MASPDTLVREMIYNSPTMFANRTQVLTYVLMGYGAGYSWRQGEIVCVHADPKPQSDDADHIFSRLVAHYSGEQLRAERSASLREVAEQQAAQVSQVRAEIEARCQQLAPLVGMPRLDAPDSRGISHSPLCTIPDDATPEWLDACQQMAHLILECVHSEDLREGDETPAPRPTAADLEARNRQRVALASVFGPADPLDMAQLEAEYETLEAERQARLKHNARTVRLNHELARQALKRIEKLRAGSGSASASA